jgi:arylsulfatase A-like enzyme
VVIGQDTALHISPSMTTMAEVMARRYPHRFGFTANTWLHRDLGHDQGFTDYHHLWDQSKTTLRRAARLGPTDVVMIPLALDWMQARADEGFFAYLHFMPPHSPYRAPEPFFSRFTIGRPSPEIGEREFLSSLEGTTPPDTLAHNIEAVYEASLAFMDEAIGGMIAEMKAAGTWDETIFVLMSDHGEAFWEHPPFKGHGGIVYEEVVRVPLVIRIPGLPELAGRRISERVELVDLLPTLIDLQDLPVRTLRLAGRSLVPLMAGAAPPPASRTIYTQTNRRVPSIHAVIKNDFKLVHHDGEAEPELYNLAVDPTEQHDLVPAGEHGPVVDVLRDHLARMRAGGSARGTVPRTVSTDSLDEASRKRLRSLGYIR